MDRRFFLALLLTMGVIVATPFLFPGKPVPVAPVVADSTAGPTAAAPNDPNAPNVPSAATQQPTAGAVSAPSAAVPPAQVARAAAPTMVRLSNGLAQYEFSSRGAALLRAELPRFKRLAGDSGTAHLSDAGRPLVSYRLLAGGDTIALDALDFVVTSDTSSGRRDVEFRAAIGSGQATIRYALAADNYLADVTITVEGVASPAYLLTELPRGFDSQERDSVDDQRHLAYAVRSKGGGAERVDFRSPDPGERIVKAGPYTWAIAKSKYFLVGLLAVDSVAPPLAEVQVTGAIRTNKVASRAQAVVVTPLGASPVRLQLFAGPQEWERLRALGREFEHANPYGGWLNSVVQPFATIAMRILLWMKRTLGLEYGWILVIFGASIRLLMWPLNSRMMRSQMVMARVAPLVQAAQAKYKNDPERQRTEVMKVYTDAGVSPFAPLAGCLPILLQMPIFFALFFVFGNTIEFRGVPFLWFPDISVKDPLYIAPVLSGGAMFLSTYITTKNSPPNPQTQMMGWLMPLMITVFGLNFASGLNLYWFVQNVASIPQQLLIARERGRQQSAAPAAVADGGERKRR